MAWTPSIEEPESITARMDALARRLRWHRRAGIGLALACGGLALLGARPAKGPAELRASRVVIVDGSGSERATLGVDADGAVGLRLRDSAGAERLAAVVGSPGPSVELFEADRKGAVRVMVEGSVPRLTLADRSGAERLWIALRLDSPAIQFLGPDGVARSGLVTMNDDTGIAVVSGATGTRPGLALYDEKRKIVWSAP
jgi:hypothetical protein